MSRDIRQSAVYRSGARRFFHEVESPHEFAPDRKSVRTSLGRAGRSL